MVPLVIFLSVKCWAANNLEISTTKENHRIIKWFRLEVDLKDYRGGMLWTGTPSTKPGPSKPHSAWS